MGDISLLPENLRGQEERKRLQTPSSVPDDGGLKMHIPESMIDEDVEIIEVDEGDLAAVLSEEPFMTRLTYKLSLWIDQLKGHLSKKEEEVPSKAPPQFFKPPKKGLVTSSHPVIETVPSSQIKPIAGLQGHVTKQLGGDHRTHVRARIMPQTEVPRRVRVIKRVRKPVRVSLISAEDLAVIGIDVPKRKWTLAIFITLFTLVIFGGYLFIRSQLEVSKSRLTIVEEGVSKISAEANEKLGQWNQYDDLEGRINLLQKALDSHVMITRLFEFLEKNTLKNVSYEGVAWSDSGQMNMKVVTKSFDDTMSQVDVMRQSPLVENVEAEGYNMTQNETTGRVEQVTFEMAIKLKDGALKGDGLEAFIEGAVSSTEASASLVP
jgi:hypothetical protein